VYPNDDQSLKNSGFDGSKKTVFFIHGYMESSEKRPDEVASIFNAFLTYDDMNVVYVDWKHGARYVYPQSVADTRVVGAQVGHFIEQLHKTTQLDINNDVHVIGFSLGAHAAGYVGDWVKKKGFKLARISGLDPAGPYYYNLSPAVRLDTSDASYVDVIHTDMMTMAGQGPGINQDIGHVDFWPNGGQFQPGCVVNEDLLRWATCGHHRSISYFMESVNSKCSFAAKECKSWDPIFKKAKSCVACNDNCRRMGYHSRDPTRTTKPGRYYLTTNNDSPFCKK